MMETHLGTRGKTKIPLPLLKKEKIEPLMSAC
jgi:hypothetical protein